MTLHFRSLDEILFSIERDLINELYNYELLYSITSDTKNIIRNMLYIKILEFLEKRHHYVYYSDSISASHEILAYFDVVTLNKFLKCIMVQLSKICNKIVYIDSYIPMNKENSENIDGDIHDKLLKLANKKTPSLKEFDKFIRDNFLGDLRSNISRVIF